MPGRGDITAIAARRLADVTATGIEANRKSRPASAKAARVALEARPRGENRRRR